MATGKSRPSIVETLRIRIGLSAIDYYLSIVEQYVVLKF